VNIWPRLSYREQYKEGDEKADKKNDGKTTSEWTGLGWNDLLQKAEDLVEWRKLVTMSSVVPPRSTRLQGRK